MARKVTTEQRGGSGFRGRNQEHEAAVAKVTAAIMRQRKVLAVISACVHEYKCLEDDKFGK